MKDLTRLKPIVEKSVYDMFRFHAEYSDDKVLIQMDEDYRLFGYGKPFGDEKPVFFCHGNYRFLVMKIMRFMMKQRYCGNNSDNYYHNNPNKMKW